MRLTGDICMFETLLVPRKCFRGRTIRFADKASVLTFQRLELTAKCCGVVAVPILRDSHDREHRHWAIGRRFWWKYADINAPLVQQLFLDFIYWELAVTAKWVFPVIAMG